MKQVLLTIDDGPSPDTKRLVDFLKSKNISTIMFFIGEKMEQHPEQVDYVIQSGVLIGNHTYSHPAMSKVTLQQGIAELEKTEAIIEAAYRRNGKPRPHKVMRFPYLDFGGPNRSGYLGFLSQQGFVPVKAPYVNHAWYQELRAEPHIGATFHCEDWELWANNPSFGIPQLLENLHVAGDTTPGASMGSLFYGESGEIFVIHDVGWSTAAGERHYEILVNELEKAPIRYMEPQFS